MAITHINQGSGTAASTNVCTVTMDANTTVGSLLTLVLMFSNESRTISSISGLGTWTEGHARQAQAGIGGLVIYGCRCTSAGTSITVTISGNSGSIDCYVREFDRSPTSFAETGTSTAFNSTAITDFTVAAVTPTSTACVFVGAVSASGSGTPWTDDADFTYFLQTNATRAAYLIQTGTTAQSFANTATTSRNGLGMLVAFEAEDPSSGGGGGKPHYYYAQQ